MGGLGVARAERAAAALWVAAALQAALEVAPMAELVGRAVDLVDLAVAVAWEALQEREAAEGTRSRRRPSCLP